MSHPDADFLKKYLAPLKGGKIVDVKVNIDDDGGFTEAWPVIIVQPKGTTSATDRFNLEVSRDEEGNGPGFLFGLPFPEQEPT